MTKPELNPTSEQNMTLERLTSLYELIQRMNSVYDLQELLRFVLDRALILTNGRHGLILLSDPHNTDLQNVAIVRGEELAEKDVERILQFVSTTVIRDVLDRGETRLVVDLQRDERYEGLTSRDTMQVKNIRSVLAVPLKTEAHLVGLIYIDHPQTGVFGENDLDLMNAFANQAALAINRAREHQRQIEELTLLNELSRSVVRALDLNEVLTRIVAEVTRMLNVEASSVLLLDEKTAELVFSTSVSYDKRLDIPTRLKKDQGVAGWVMTHSQPASINDVSRDPRWFGEVETGFVTHSILCVPLQTEGRVVGVLEALNKRSPQGFSAGDLTLLSAFAASATIAIENARLFQEVRQVHQLRALNQFALTLSSTLDLNKILDESLEQTLIILRAEAGVISLINDQTYTDLFAIQLNPETPRGTEKSEQQIRALSGLMSWLLGQNINELLKSGILILDDSKDRAQLSAHLNLAAGEIRTLALAPIEARGTIAGFLVVLSTEPHLYTPEEISLLSSITHIVGLAAQNAIHYLKMQGQATHLAYLNEIGSVLTRSLDLDHVLKVIIEGVNSLLQTELTSVFLIDNETNELVLRYSTKGGAEIRLPAPWQGIAGWVATQDRPALVNNTHSDPRHLRQIAIETGYEAHSILCVPLKVEGKVIGVVEVLNKMEGRQFNHYHQAMLIELTKWAAIALHNARLFDERIQAYQRLNAEQQRRVAAETRGAMAAIILDIAHTMNNSIGAVRVWASRLGEAISTTPQASITTFEKEIRQIRQNAQEALGLLSTMTGPLKQAAVTPTDVHYCLNTAVKSCWWPDNIHLTTLYDQNIPPVKANVERLEAVFQNLLSNSIQALTPDGGEIQIQTQYTAENEVQITIADDGPGIPFELQRQIFDPGVSGKDGGLGIGLWLVETFINQFNGRISFTSSAAEGTTFTVILQPINFGILS